MNNEYLKIFKQYLTKMFKRTLLLDDYGSSYVNTPYIISDYLQLSKFSNNKNISSYIPTAYILLQKHEAQFSYFIFKNKYTKRIVIISSFKHNASEADPNEFYATFSGDLNNAIKQYDKSNIVLLSSGNACTSFVQIFAINNNLPAYIFDDSWDKNNLTFINEHEKFNHDDKIRINYFQTNSNLILSCLKPVTLLKQELFYEGVSNYTNVNNDTLQYFADYLDKWFGYSYPDSKLNPYNTKRNFVSILPLSTKLNKISILKAFIYIILYAFLLMFFEVIDLAFLGNPRFILCIVIKLTFIILYAPLIFKNYQNAYKSIIEKLNKITLNITLAKREHESSYVHEVIAKTRYFGCYLTVSEYRGYYNFSIGYIHPALAIFLATVGFIMPIIGGVILMVILPLLAIHIGRRRAIIDFGKNLLSQE